MKLVKNYSAKGQYNIIDTEDKILGVLFTSSKFSKLKKSLSLRDSLTLEANIKKFKKSLCLETMYLKVDADFHDVLKEVLEEAPKQILADDRKYILMIAKDKELDIALEYGYQVHSLLVDSNFSLVYKQVAQ